MPGSHVKPAKRRLRLIWLAPLFLCLVALAFARPVQNQILRYAVLHSETANESAIQSVIQRAADPAATMWQLWQTRKIPQRQLVLDCLKEAALANPDLGRQMMPLVEQAALDVDANVRERALAMLEKQKDPLMLELARAQFQDADPQIRILGLQYLRRTGDKRLVPELMPVLDDPEPVVAASADSLLRKWTGNDFGLRLSDALGGSLGDPGVPLEADKVASIREIAVKWRAWWQTNQSDYSALPQSSARLPERAGASIAGDFELRDLSGRRVHLDDFKGKVVLLNFWTTWCTACQVEIPSLVELQKRHPGDLVILAVSLDGAPVEDDDEIEAKPGVSNPLTASPAEIKKKIEHLIQSRGINYAVLLDPAGKIGARFNGHELPTNVLIGPDGVVRRRFIGGRSINALEAMMQQALKSP